MPYGNGLHRGFLFILTATVVSILLLQCFPFPSSAEGAPTRGNDLEVGTGFPYSSIQAAFSAASPGDRIVVHPGVYNENLVLDKTVELHGTDINNTIINGSGSTALVIDADNCIISGLNITGGLPVGWSGGEVGTAGLEIRSDGNEVFGCYFHDNYFGIFLNSSDRNWIHDSISTHNGEHGIFMVGSSDNSFDNLFCLDNGYNGFGFFVSPDNEFFYCRAEGNGVNGWEIWDSEGEYVRFSTASDNGRMGFQIGGAYGTNSLVNCYVAGNSQDGVWIYSDSPQKVENCTIGGNQKFGIRLSFNGLPTSAVITGNLIINNSGKAIEIDDGCGSSLIFGNDLIDNGRWQSSQASENGTRSGWNNGMVGNFWSDWTSPDSNKDGIVDVPYTVAGSASGRDSYPSTTRMTPHFFGYGIQPGPAVLYGPHITQTSLANAVAGKGYTQQISCSDRDTPQELLNWSLDTDSSWLDLDGGVLSGTPGENDIGTTHLIVMVSDGVHSDMRSFSIVVGPGSGLPIENPGYGMIDIGGWENLTAGKVTLEANDLTNGDQEFLEYRWFVEGAFRGKGGSITMELEEGRYDVDLKAMTSDGEWFVISRAIDVGPAPDRPDGPGTLYYGILAASAVFGILIAVILWGFYMRGRRKRVRPVAPRRTASPIKDRTVAPAVRATGAGPRVGLETPGAVWGGPLVEGKIMDEMLGKEEKAHRGPVMTGPRTSVEEEYLEIEREALSWKKVSRFTMDRGKMHSKLKRKFEEGELDRQSFEELGSLIDSYMTGDET